MEEYLALTPGNWFGYVHQTRKRDKGTCQICGDIGRVPPKYKDFKTREEYKQAREIDKQLAALKIPIHEVDHIVPISEGGTNHLSNLRCLCKKCHQKVTGELNTRLAEKRKAETNAQAPQAQAEQV